jgi:DNA-binding NtrC family response regulator
LAVAQGQIGSLASLCPDESEEKDGDLSSITTLKALRDAVTARYERRLIEAALKRNGGNKSRAAAELDVTRKTLAEKMAQFGLGAVSD